MSKSSRGSAVHRSAALGKATHGADDGSDVLVIEDIRTFRFPCVYARTLQEGWDLIFSKPWREVWLDHGLALTIAEWEKPEGTVKPLVDEMERLAIQDGVILPIGQIYVHTANPYGGNYIMQALGPHYPCQRVVANDYLATGSVRLEWTGPTDVVNPTHEQVRDMVADIITDRGLKKGYGIRLLAAGHTTSEGYTDYGKELDIAVHVHDTTDDIMVNIGNSDRSAVQWFDFELDFANAKLLIEALQYAIDRGPGHPPKIDPQSGG